MKVIKVYLIVLFVIVSLSSFECKNDTKDITVTLASYPHNVAILRRKKGFRMPGQIYGYFKVAGGSIIHKSWVLTCATCLRVNEKRMDSDIMIELANDQLQHETLTPMKYKKSNNFIKVGKTVFHPSYSEKSPGIYELALLKLQESIDSIGSKAQKIQMLLAPTKFDRFISIGYSKDEKGQKLIGTTIDSMSPRKCIEKYGGKKFNEADFYCLVPTGPSNLCWQTYGSGIIGETKDAKRYLSAILTISSKSLIDSSGRFSCPENDTFAIATRLTPNIVNWVTETLTS